jgi:hypothetical protein
VNVKDTVVVDEMTVVAEMAVTVDVSKADTVDVGIKLVDRMVVMADTVEKRVTVVMPVKGLNVVDTWVIVRVVPVVSVVRIVGELT